MLLFAFLQGLATQDYCQLEDLTKGIQGIRRQPSMPVVELRQGTFVDSSRLCDLVSGQAGVVDCLPQLVSQFDGRKKLNFSEWDRYTEEQRIKKLKKCSSEVMKGEMPMWIYLPTHREAVLSAQDKAILNEWFANTK